MPTDSLTPGERAVRCFLGEPVDHVPFGVGLGWLPWNQATERWAAESGKPDLDPARELGFEPSFAVPEIQAGLFPGFAPTVLEEDETTITRRNEQGITMRVRRDGLSMPQFLEYPVKTQEDWEQIKAERLDPAAPGRLPQDWDAFRDRLRLTGEGVQVGCYPYGVFGTPRDLMGTEDLLLGFYLRPEIDPRHDGPLDRAVDFAVGCASPMKCRSTTSTFGKTCRARPARSSRHSLCASS